MPLRRLGDRSAGRSDRDLLRIVTDAVDRGRSAALVTVVDTQRSVPRRAGAKLVVTSDGLTFGTIGGGEMEARCISEARDALADGRPRRLHYDLLDATGGDPGVCGGSVELYVEPFMPTRTVVVVGCGHVGRAVVDLAAWLGYRVVATDDRAELATAEALPSASAVFAGPVSEVLAAESIGAHTAIIMVTRNMAVDLEALPPLLASGAGFVGVMGSRRRWEQTHAALLARGVTESELARVHSPIGVEIAAETPEEIAVSILAEVTAHFRSNDPSR
jgi:xanthine dehydrogenase accessory factor